MSNDEPLAELAEITTYFPRVWEEAAHLFTETFYEDTALDGKAVQLILCSLLAAKGWVTGLRVHAQQALQLGASAPEVRGAVLLTWAVNGLSGAAAGLHQIEDLLSNTSSLGG